MITKYLSCFLQRVCDSIHVTFDLHSAEELIQLVSKLEHSTDVDASCRLSRQILDFLELHVTDYRTNQVGGSVLHAHTNTLLWFQA